MDRLQPTSGQVIAIFGSGPAGSLLVALAVKAGLTPVVSVEIRPQRRALALRMGADIALNPSADDFRMRVDELTDGNGFRYLVDAVGSSRVLEQALAVASRGATILIFGVAHPDDRLAVSPNEIYAKELSLLGTALNPFTHRRAANLVNGIGWRTSRVATSRWIGSRTRSRRSGTARSTRCSSRRTGPSREHRGHRGRRYRSGGRAASDRMRRRGARPSRCVDRLGPLRLGIAAIPDHRTDDAGRRHRDARDTRRGVLGAVGMPQIPDTETLWGLLIPIRREFEQYVNLRPVRALPGIPSPVTGGDKIDLLIVRENNEGEYSEIGGRAYRGRAQETAIQVDVFTRAGVERVAQFAVDIAAQRSGRLTSATKSNGIIHSMPFWDQVVAEIADTDERVTLDSVLIDALAAKLVLAPGQFDVIVASNLFGDILSDLAGAIAGSIGVAPSANLNPERRYPSLFEPVHGSAPDIAGQGIANPFGQIWTGAMMLEHLGHRDAAADLVRAFEAVLASGVRTPDLAGTASTTDVGSAVVAELSR